MFFVLVLALLLANVGIPSASARVPPPFTVQKRILGRSTSVSLQSDGHPSDGGASGSISSVLFGRPLSLIRMDTTPAQALTPSGGTVIASTRLEVSGIPVWRGDLRFDQGALRYSGAIPPVRIPFPVLMYPLGPVLLRLDVGMELDGKLEASLTPGLSVPVTDSSIEAKLSGDLAASGYAEGYGSLYLVRAGIEGRVDLIEGDAGVASMMYLNQSKPRTDYFGRAVFMKGDIEGFVDAHVPLLSWRRILSKIFFSWPGRCFAFGADSCTAP